MRRSFSPAAVWLALGALISIAPELRAQQPATADSLPFRKGQWAGQFTLGADQHNIGVLRFRSPRVAWLLDGWFNVSTSRQQYDRYAYDSRQTNLVANLRLGRRVYHQVEPHIAGFYTLGLMGSGGRYLELRRSPGTSGGIVTDTLGSIAWQAGAFGELGASYLVTQHLSLGMTAGSLATYSASREYGTSRGRGRAFQVSAGVFTLVTAIYF